MSIAARSPQLVPSADPAQEAGLERVVLGRALDVHIGYEPMPYGWGWLVLYVGGRHFRVKRIDRAELRAIVRWAQDVPQRMARVDGCTCWMYRQRYYWDHLGLRQHEVHNLLLELSVVDDGSADPVTH